MIDNTFNIKPSRTLKILLISLHGLSLIAAVMNTLPIMVKISLILFILLHFVWYWKKYVTQAVTTQFSYSDTAGWERITNQVPIAITILPSSLLTSWLIIIHYHQPPSTTLKTQICFKDALAPSAFRTLTVQLKINGIQTPSNAP